MARGLRAARVGNDTKSLRTLSALCGEDTLLRALTFLFYGSVGAWAPYLNVYLQQVGLSGLQIGILTGLRPAAAIFSQPLWGVVADVQGRRRTLLLTMFLATMLLPGFVGGRSFWFLFAWAILYALLSSPIGSLLDSLVLDHLEREQNSSYGLFRMWGAIGWAALTLAAGCALEGRDLRLIFAFGALLMGAGLLVALRTPRALGGAGPVGARWKDAVPLLRNRRLVTFLVLITFLQVGASPAFSFYSIYMNELGASRQLIGLSFAVLGLSELPLYLSAAGIIRRIGPARTLVIAFLLLSVRSFLYSCISQPAWAVVVQLAHGSLALFLVAAVEYTNQLVPSAWRATGQSLLWVAQFGIGSMLGNALGGALYDQVGARAMFRLSGLAILAATAGAAVALRGNHPRQD
jgi:PPP family 3-phenylpropionic acid transporter